MPKHKSRKPRHRHRGGPRRNAGPLSAAEQDALEAAAIEEARQAHRLTRAGDTAGAARALNAANRNRRLVAGLAAWAERARHHAHAHEMSAMTTEALYARLETLLATGPETETRS